MVGDTVASLRYYRDVLGLQVAGESENFGPEQERLNNALGARLRITTLRAAAGPGVELLEYLAPRDGRWQIYFVVSDAEAAFSPARAARGR